MERRRATGGDDPLGRRPGRMHGILGPVLALPDLDFQRTADADQRHSTGQLSQPLPRLLPVVIGGGLVNLRPDLRDAALDVLQVPDILRSAVHVF
jgi:hypothetical protein